MGTTLRKTRVVRFSPTTLCDSADLTDGPQGGCAALINLTPDPSTKNLWSAKPEQVSIETFSDLSSPNNVDCIFVVGNYVYGLIQTSLNAGKSQPFCYNISDIFVPTPVTVYNILSANCPSSYFYNSGASPPTMAQIGNLIVVTHPGFAGPPYIGWFDISTPTQPVWMADGLAPVGGILSVAITAGGTGYDGGATAVFASVPITGGSGTLATATIFVTAGVVTRVAVNAYGTNYANTDTGLSFSNTHTGGSGSGFTMSVTAVQTTSSIALTVVPTWVAQFYERTWLGINPAAGIPSVIFTDILVLGCTNASQALTFGDTIATTAGAGIGLNNQLGGIIQALIIFKGVSYIIQITGDAALSTLAVNSLNVATGTPSARGVTTTPHGLIFAAPDGLREIDFNMNVGEPIGFGGQGVTQAFTYGVLAANSTYYLAIGCNRGVVRVSIAWQPPFTEYSVQPTQVYGEYWYDLNLKCWSGPHAEPYSQYCNYLDGWVAYLGGAGSSGSGSNGILFGLVSYPANGSNYLPMDNLQLTTGVLSSPSPMSQLEITETTVMTTAPSQIPHMTVQIIDQEGNVLGTQTFNFNPGTSPSTYLLYPRQISWTRPIVVTRFAVNITCATVERSLVGMKIGDIWLRVRDLDYIQELPG